jgi:hypothetical protein
MWIRAGTSSRIWNPLERMTPPALRAGSGFDRRGPRVLVVSGGLLGWSTTVKPRRDESLVEGCDGVGAACHRRGGVMVVVGVSGLERRIRDVSVDDGP